MKIFRYLCLSLLLLALAPLAHADYLDRVVAAVNGAPILWSDVEQEVRIQALIEGTPPGEITLQKRNEALNRMIDAMLLSQQLREAHARVDEADEQQRMAKVTQELRRQRHAAASDAAWQKLLREYGLDQAALNEHLRQQVDVLEFVDLRFRAGAQATPHQINEYYNSVFIPAMKKRGAPVPSLASVEPKIQAVLLERNIDEAMGQWLKAIRSQANIWRAPPFDRMTTGRL
ncbi:MAG: SurA N-terminal domain-containing protein [Acidobacteriaceae bacterium]